MPIQLPIVHGGEEAVVPQQCEQAAHGLAAPLEALEQGQGGEAEVARGDQGALDQAQGELGHGVEHRLGVVRAAAESRTVGIAEGAVIVEAGLLPAVGGDGPCPAQEMHATAPLGLFYTFFLANTFSSGVRSGLLAESMGVGTVTTYTSASAS